MKYSEELVQAAVSQSESVTDVMKILGIKMAGGSHSHITRVIKKFGIDTSHFLGQAYRKGKTFGPKKTADEIFNYSLEYRPKAKDLNRALLESGIEYKCVLCLNNGTWCGSKLVLHVDHIDGDWKNNAKENLRFLCPNCHTQTKTYGNKKR